MLAPRPRVDLFELAALTAFAAVSVWVLGLDLWQVIVHGREWTDTDGLFLSDQMQYLAWIQDASRHVLASDVFVVHRRPADYFQPLVVISGGLTALGMAPWLSLLVWKPIAVISGFFVVRAYARRCLTGIWERRAALLLAVFFGAWGVIGDLWLPFWSWGYPFGLIAIAALAGALLLYDRAWSQNRLAWGPPLLGALASSLHPWQGEALILIVVGAEVLLRLPRRLRARAGHRATKPSMAPARLALPLVTVAATAVPLVYLAILGRADLSWRLARDASHHTYPLASILLALAPLLAAAALAYRRRGLGFLGVATRVWPLAALVVYAVSATSLSATPLHAFAGITIPLAMLGVEGVQSAGWSRVPGHRALGALAVAAATIPATVSQMRAAPYYVSPARLNANFISSDMHRALGFLSTDPESGAVLTRAYLGVIIPGETGRNTYVAGCQWSQPDCAGRTVGAKSLFSGAMAPPAARAFVLATGARFVLSGCGWGPSLRRVLAPILRAVHRYGCASVYEIEPAGNG